MRRWALLVAFAAAAAAADEQLAVCYDWGCAAEARVVFREARLDAIRGLLLRARTPAEERWAISRAIGTLYGWAGEQSPIGTDRAGNRADAEAPGRMDCIDHSTSTTRLLRMLEARGWLRFHRVLDPARRMPFVVVQHFAAVIEEKKAPLLAALQPRAVPPALEAPRPVPDYAAAMLYACADCDDLWRELRPPPRPVPPPELPRAEPPAEVGERFVVDSWFVDNGRPAVILRLKDWMEGEGPDVD